MTYHTVIWTCKDGVDKKSACETIRPVVENLVGTVPGLIKLRIGFNIHDSDAAWDLVLNSEHESDVALETYRVHPAHLEAKKYIGDFVQNRAVVDWH